MSNLQIIPGASEAEIAGWLEACLTRALAATSSDIAINVPGGSTPFPILAELAREPLEWHRIAIWPGDDRIVPEEHPASNLGRMRESLAPTNARIVPLTEHAQPPRFALTWLGMGNDGHIASLFPNTDPRADDPRPVVRVTPDPLPPEAPFERVSLTMPSLLASDELLFVMRGEEKRALFEEAAAGGNDLPVARLLAAARQPVTCFT